jgi:precorrin-6B methylase 2
MLALTKEGIAVDLCHIAEHCHVDDARNAMVREFLMSKASHLVFIDNDVGFAPGNLIRLAKHDRDMVAGVYPLKEEGEGYPIRIKDGVELWAESDGLVEVEGLPTGFLKISRACIERMIEVYGDRKFYGRGQSHDDQPHVVLFERTYENGVRYSGDYAFCEKWKAIGGKMYVDPEMHFSHSGTNEWNGSLGDYWRRIYGVNESKFNTAIEQMRLGKFNAEIANDLITGWGNNYCASVNTLVACWHSARKAKTILETGSGLSTIVMALANPECKVLSLESGAFFAEQTQSALKKHGINNAMIMLSPLKEYEQGKWYDFNQSKPYDLIVLDGPNRQLGNRNIAFDVLDIGNSAVLIDDADDETLLAAFRDWAVRSDREVVQLGVTKKTAAISIPKKEAQCLSA